MSRWRSTTPVSPSARCSGPADGAGPRAQGRAHDSRADAGPLPRAARGCRVSGGRTCAGPGCGLAPMGPEPARGRGTGSPLGHAVPDTGKGGHPTYAASPGTAGPGSRVRRSQPHVHTGADPHVGEDGGPVPGLARGSGEDRIAAAEHAGALGLELVEEGAGAADQGLEGLEARVRRRREPRGGFGNEALVLPIACRGGEPEAGPTASLTAPCRGCPAFPGVVRPPRGGLARRPPNRRAHRAARGDSIQRT